MIFDLDGVIVDTERLIHAIWARVYKEHGAAFTNEEWLSGVGTDGAFCPYDVLQTRACMPLPSRSALNFEIEAEVSASIRAHGPMPGVRELIEDALAAGLQVALASSSPSAWVDARLEDAGLARHIFVRSCKNCTLRAKPAPDVYLDACARIDVSPSEAIAIEDSHNGLRAALAAGLHAVAVPNTITKPMAFEEARLVLDTLLNIDSRAILRLLEAGIQ